MIERLLVLGALFCLGSAAFLALRAWQMRRASRVGHTHGRPAILYFRSDSCAPCVMQWRFLQQLQAQLGEQITIEKIDADQQRELTDCYGVFTLPTTLVMDSQGQVKHANYGLTDAGKLARQVRAVI